MCQEKERRGGLSLLDFAFEQGIPPTNYCWLDALVALDGCVVGLCLGSHCAVCTGDGGLACSVLCALDMMGRRKVGSSLLAAVRSKRLSSCTIAQVGREQWVDAARDRELLAVPEGAPQEQVSAAAAQWTALLGADPKVTPLRQRFRPCVHTAAITRVRVWAVNWTRRAQSLRV